MTPRVTSRASARRARGSRVGRLELHCARLLRSRSGGCRLSDLRSVGTSANRWCLLLSVVCRAAADLVWTGEVRSHLVVDASGCCCRRTRDGIGRRGEERQGRDHPRLGKELLEGLAEGGSKVIERQSGDPPWQGLVSEPAMDRAGIDAAGSADLGKA